MKREEAVELLKELNANQLVSPHLVLIEQKDSGNYQLQIRGDYNRQAIGVFIKKKHFACEMKDNDLIIY
jgi:hypothetical protein